jgi:uncharacterized protein DUF6027
MADDTGVGMDHDDSPPAERPPNTVDDPVVRLERWDGHWPDDDPDSNFKSDVALYSLLDPLATIDGLSRNLGIPVGAVCRYVLAKWATGGSGGLLELGPTMTRRLAAICDEAEAVGTDEARVAAYQQLREMLAWLQLPLDRPGTY